MDCLEPLTVFDEQDVDADAFFEDIAKRLMTRFQAVGTSASIHVDAQIIDIPVSLARDLGRIAEALLENACTHGRSAGGSATAWLSFHIHRNLIHLAVEDDGPGLCDGFDLDLARGDGFGQMNTFLGRCNGAARWCNPKGARVEICIPQHALQELGSRSLTINDDLRARREAKRQGRWHAC